MGKFRVLYEESNKRVFVGVEEYVKNEWDKFIKDRGEMLKKYDKKYQTSYKKDMIKRYKIKWFDIIFDMAEKGKFIDWMTLNDVWNLDPDGLNNFMYRLRHDIPNGNFETRWIYPKRGERARGMRYSKLPLL